MKTFESYDKSHRSYAWRISKKLVLSVYINTLCPWGFHLQREYKSISVRVNSYFIKLHFGEYRIIKRSINE